MAGLALQSFYASILILSFVGKGLCASNCSMTFKDIEVSQIPTGEKVQGKTEYNVTVWNTCACTHQNVNLSCPGFNTVEPIDPAVFSVAGGSCIVPLVYASLYDPVVFKYAWNSFIPLTPFASQVACS